MAGRRGNKVFQTLTENAGNKSPWAAAHPWQSWRNRYMKDQPFFDSRILRYRRKQESDPVDDSMAKEKKKIMQKLKRPPDKKMNPKRPASDEEENGDDVAASATEQPQDYESIKEEDDEQSDVNPNSEAGLSVENGSTAHASASERANDPEVRPPSPRPLDHRKRPVRKKRKRFRSGASDDSDAFASFPPSPHSPAFSPLPISRTARPPPRYIKGHFYSRLTDSKGKIRSTRTKEGASDTDTENEKRRKKVLFNWPPRRSRGQTTQQAAQSRVTGDTVLQAPSVNVDRGIQISDFHDEPTPKPLKSNAAVRTVRIASDPILAVSPPPVQDIDEQPDHHHHPFSQPSQFPEVPFSASSESDNHHPFSQPTQVRDQPIDTMEDVDLGPLTNTPKPTGDNPTPRGQVRDTSLDFTRQHTIEPRKPGTLPSGEPRSDLALSGREDLTLDPFRSYRTIRHNSRGLESTKAHVAISNSSDNMHTSRNTSLGSSIRSTGEPKTDNVSVSMGALDQDSRRRTFGGLMSHTTNSGTAHQARQSRASLPDSHKISSHSRQPSRKVVLPDARLSLSVSARDQTNDDEFLKFLIRKMSENHGFHENVTWNLWRKTRNLPKVDKTLKGMREVAQAFANQVVEADDGEEEEEEDPRPRELEGRDSPRAGDSNRWSSLPYRSPRPHARVDHRFTPVPVRGDLDVEYTPPEASRAGRLAQLAQRGLIDDGFRRKTASNGGSPLKDKPITRLLFSSPHAFDTTREGNGSSPESVKGVGGKKNAVLQNGDEESADENRGRHSYNNIGRIISLKSALSIQCWRGLQTGIKTRDANRCVVCGVSQRGALDYCHIIPEVEDDKWQEMKDHGFVPAAAKGVEHEARNGIRLCKTHHGVFDAHGYYIRWMPEERCFVFINHSQSEDLEEYHGRAIDLSEGDDRLPFHGAFLFHEMRVRGYWPLRADRAIPLPIPWLDWLDDGEDGHNQGPGKNERRPSGDKYRIPFTNPAALQAPKESFAKQPNWKAAVIPSGANSIALMPTYHIHHSSTGII